MAPCRERHPTPFRFEERRIQGLYGLKTTLFLVLTQSRAGASFWCRAGRFQTLKQRRLFYVGNINFDPFEVFSQKFTYNVSLISILCAPSPYIIAQLLAWFLLNIKCRLP